MKAIILIYNPPELFPPTLWAIQELSRRVEEITVVTRNIAVEPWSYPENVKIIRTGPSNTLNEALPTISKLNNFFGYRSHVARTIARYGRDGKSLILAYDSVALFAMHITLRGKWKRNFIKWFHSHDVPEVNGVSKFSISWLAAFYQNRGIAGVDFFTLPSQERLTFYNLDSFKGKVSILPNYPSRTYVQSINLPKPDLDQDKSVRLIYQGSISPGHCLEDVIRYLAKAQRPAHLTLIGWCSDSYRGKLLELAKACGVSEFVTFIPAVPYHKLYFITASQHIGLAIHKPENIIYSTGGTASNKIYEYAAVGLPVILYDNIHFRTHCGNFEWAFFTDGSAESIAQCVEDILKNYQEFSKAAQADFSSNMYYENSFNNFLTNELML